MSAQPSRPRSLLKTAAVLFLPAACLLAVCYLVYDRPPAARPSHELAPSNLGQGFAPQVDLPTQVVGAESRSDRSRDLDPTGQNTLLNALEARRSTGLPQSPVEGLNRR